MRALKRSSLLYRAAHMWSLLGIVEKSEKTSFTRHELWSDAVFNVFLAACILTFSGFGLVLLWGMLFVPIYRIPMEYVFVCAVLAILWRDIGSPAYRGLRLKALKRRRERFVLKA